MTVTVGQQIVYEDPSSVCSLGVRPIIVQGFILEHLRRHFADQNSIQDPSLQNYLWQANIDRNNIMIEPMTKWNPTLSGARPAILIRRNSWQVIPMGVGANLMQGSVPFDGADRYTVVMGGSHTIFCLAKEAGECEILGAEVYLELLEYATIIRQRAELLRFQVTEIGPVQPIEESRTHFGLPITVAYAHNHSWIVRKQAPILHKVNLSTFRP